MKEERNKNRNSTPKSAPTHRKPASTDKHSGVSYGDKYKSVKPVAPRSEDGYAKKTYGAKPTAPRSENGYGEKTYGAKPSAPRSENGYGKKTYGERPAAPRSENGYTKKHDTEKPKQFTDAPRPERARKLYPVRVHPRKTVRQAQPLLNPEMPASTDWQDVAGWYNSLVGQQGSEYHQRVILPGVERMLKETGNSFDETKIFDLACGQGVLCRRLAGAGARVTGVDLSQDMLDLAKTYQREGVKQVTYLKGDATDLIDEDGHLRLGLQAGSFDAVTSVLSIQNMSPLSGVWQAAYQLLKPGGVLIVVMMHPCFRIPQRSDWQWQQKDQRQVRTMWSYLSSEEMRISAHPGKEAVGEESASTIHFHRPLQAYINTLGNAGLLVEHCEEWVSHKKEQESAKKAALDQARSEFPMFLALKCRKIGV